MNYEYELNFFCDILARCHIGTTLLSLHDTADLLIESRIRTFLAPTSDPDKTIQKLLGTIEDVTKYQYTDNLKQRYLFLRLPLLSEKNLLFIGPYLAAPLSSGEVFEIGEQLGLTPSTQDLLKDYYVTLPIIAENDHLLHMVDAFCERIWQTPSFSVAEIRGDLTVTTSSLDTLADGDNAEDVLASMKNMEMRYDFENQLIQAVVLGQQHKESLLVSVLNEQMFEQRLQDPIRNARNYCIIMNTLLRKGAEQGGVHPMYIDRVSSKIASKIERLTDTKATTPLMREIFSSYCRLVNEHSTQQYSPHVKKAILIIDANFASELSLGTVAQRLDISAGYLATIFKKETGKTVSEYIRHKRIHHATHLLRTTHLQIQTIATHCGIVDVQYFSKLFKKQTGKTPKEYREAVQRA